MPLTITEDNFDSEVLNSNQPVLVDFWAEWCGPCKQISPILSEIAKEYENKITIAKINIDNNPEVPSKYGILSIPTLILFNNGKMVGSQIGLLDKQTLTNWIDENI